MNLTNNPSPVLTAIIKLFDLDTKTIWQKREEGGDEQERETRRNQQVGTNG